MSDLQQSYSGNEELTEETINYRAIFNSVMDHWWWYILSLACCCVVAFFYIKSATPIYSVSNTIMIMDEKRGGGSMLGDAKMLESLGVYSNQNTIDNEVIVLQSRDLITSTLVDAQQYVLYHVEGLFRDTELYRNSPIEARMLSATLNEMTEPLHLEMLEQTKDQWLVTYPYTTEDLALLKDTLIKKLPATVFTAKGAVELSKNTQGVQTGAYKLKVDIYPPKLLALTVKSNLSVMPASKTTSIASLALQTTNKRKGIDFLNTLIDVYNRDANNDKIQVAHRTDEFIKSRLMVVTGELSETESSIEAFKKSTGMISPENNAQMSLTESAEYQKKCIENETQINLVNYLKNYVNNPNNSGKPIPANVGLADLPLTALISEYNAKLMEYNQLKKNSLENNPVIIRLYDSMRDNFKTIVKQINSVMTGLRISKSDLERQQVKYQSIVHETPGIERVLTDITRQQEIKSSLYLLLLRKREENSINMAAQSDIAKVIDPAMAHKFPVAPKKKMIALITLFFALAIPSGLIYLVYLLRNTIRTQEDIDKNTKLPLLGLIPHNPQVLDSRDSSITVAGNKNTHHDESFRRVRTNIRFVLRPNIDKVIAVTSTTSGEGKTYVATNLAISLAILEKKVLIIGADLRKPRVSKALGHKEDKTQIGLSSLLADPSYKLDDCIVKVNDIDYPIDLLPAGSIPPNAAELLHSARLDQIIQELRDKYDYIILDTAPMALVSDTSIMARVVDMTCYVVRAGKAHRQDLKFAEMLNATMRLPRISLVLNDADTRRRGYGYGHYGYGETMYGYSYGNNSK